MRKMTKKNKIAAVALSATLLAAGGGAAYAYWSTTGGGSGSAAASKGTDPVSISVTFDQGLAPGGSEDILYSATNPNSSSTTVTLDKAVVTATGNCDTSWITASVPSGTITIAAGATEALGKGTLSFADTATNQDSCKGAIITVTANSK
ncbi:hypothetical protein [Pseudarthrobacter sp. NIBRBAC000502771]|uniref:hypothetical protein n=1 Tax=Pseudarthrobacter sp. NIBRBAC000502771 TaxID=2590774 RepID=UPI00113181F4|nr:hypothetical protein [Pseudarthrobacter sp. NIBRBAC000502771]QDG62592.1 hypothetical protein NIBR502771_09840 [Pseudarthrobacter sp. NIBRBAC000502771]